MIEPVMETHSRFRIDKMVREDLKTDLHRAKQWDDFVAGSPQGTIFSSSSYLLSTEREFALYLVKKGESIRAGFSVITDGGRRAVLDDTVIYNGLMFAKENAADGFNHQKKISDEFQLMEFLIPSLEREFDHLECALSPHLQDLRPFLWLNYHEADAFQKFRLDLRYTSYLDLQKICGVGSDEDEKIWTELGVSRRQEIRYARRDGVKAEASRDIESFLTLYELTMRKSNPHGDFRDHLNRMNHIMQGLLESGSGKLYLVKTEQGEVSSGAFFGWDSKRAYYLFGGSHPERQNRYSGTIVLWDALRDLALMGIKEVDLEGVNSPNRGWFKLSFGGTLTSYFQVTLR